MRVFPYLLTCLLILGPVVFTVIFPTRAEGAPGEWTVVGPMLQPRCYPSVARADGNRLLIVGDWPQAEIYDLDTETSSNTGTMNTVMLQPAAVSLPDGRVLVVGGPGGIYPTPSPAAEVFDPSTQIFTPVASPPLQGFRMKGALLGDGTVLVVGGAMNPFSDPGGPWTALAQAAVFDPSDDSWTSVEPMHEVRALGAAASLMDGRVVVAGGTQYGSTLSLTVEVFDPITHQFAIIGTLDNPHLEGGVADLGNGWVLVTGSGSAELINLTTGEVRQAGDVGVPREYTTLTVLPGPRALILTTVRDVDLYDSTTDTLMTVTPMNLQHKAAALANGPGGLVYVFGGSYWDGAQFLCRAEVEQYESGFGTATGESCNNNLECLSGYCVDEVCCAQPCDTPPSTCMAPQCGGGNCTYVPLESGQACEDGDPCTYDDACDGDGRCVGTPYECVVGPCDETSICNGDGTCSAVTLPEGTVCDDLDPCTTEDRCTGGVCSGTQVEDCSPTQGPNDSGCSCTATHMYGRAGSGVVGGFFCVLLLVVMVLCFALARRLR